jgi:hypothetical protein
MMSWVLIVCPTILWGACGVQIPVSVFETYEHCISASKEIAGTEKPALAYCTNHPEWLKRMKP